VEASLEAFICFLLLAKKGGSFTILSAHPFESLSCWKPFSNPKLAYFRPCDELSEGLDCADVRSWNKIWAWYVIGWDSLESENFAHVKLEINEITGNHVPEIPEKSR
jgi:hypothetical protein